MPFALPQLPYAYGALEPTIDATTMQIHHSKHHQAYVDKLNEAVAEDSSLGGLSLEQILARISSLPRKVRNNGGGHWNHSFFWDSMTPGGNAPAGPLAEAIDRAFGSLDALRTRVNDAGVGQFGSGWVWLIVDGSGGLAISATPNQDNPLMDDVPVRGTPILGNDLWEHAYYLKYQNRRAEYLTAWWSVVDWRKVAQRYEAVTG